MLIEYRPKGVCSKQMRIEVQDGRITNLDVIGGCHGNIQGISRLVKGMPIDEVVEKLEGIRCGFKKTSCPDQLAQALKEEFGADAS